MKSITAIRDWLARWWLAILAVCGVVILASVLMVGCEGNKVVEAVESNPPLAPKVAAALRKKSTGDSIKAEHATKIARVYHKQADSALAVAKTLTAQADSAHAEVRSLSTPARGPISAVQRALADYQPADTAGL